MSTYIVRLHFMYSSRTGTYWLPFKLRSSFIPETYALLIFEESSHLRKTFLRLALPHQLKFIVGTYT